MVENPDNSAATRDCADTNAVSSASHCSMSAASWALRLPGSCGGYPFLIASASSSSAVARSVIALLGDSNDSWASAGFTSACGIPRSRDCALAAAYLRFKSIARLCCGLEVLSSAFGCDFGGFDHLASRLADVERSRFGMVGSTADRAVLPVDEFAGKLASDSVQSRLFKGADSSSLATVAARCSSVTSISALWMLAAVSSASRAASSSENSKRPKAKAVAWLAARLLRSVTLLVHRATFFGSSCAVASIAFVRACSSSLFVRLALSSWPCWVRFASTTPRPANYRCGLLESLRCRGRIKQRIASEISGELDFQRVGRQRCIFKPRTRAFQLLIGGRQQPRFAQPVSIRTGGLVIVGAGEQFIDLAHVSQLAFTLLVVVLCGRETLPNFSQARLRFVALQLGGEGTCLRVHDGVQDCGERV